MDLEELRQRKTAELQQRLSEQQSEQEAVQEFEMKKDSLLKKVMTPDAKSRLTRLKLANASFGEQVEKLILYLAQSGQITKVDDSTLKMILEKIRGKKRDITITRK